MEHSFLFQKKGCVVFHPPLHSVRCQGRTKKRRLGNDRYTDELGPNFDPAVVKEMEWNMKAYLDGKLYDTDKMECIYDSGADGSGVGHRTYIWITPKSRQLVVEHDTCWQGEHDSLALISVEDASEYPGFMDDAPDDILKSLPRAE